MYNVDKFFKLLSTNESANDSQDADSMFKLLLLISIYQNYVLLNKENPENHQVFQEFFRVSQHDREKLKSWLINVKNLIEANNPLGKSNQSADVLMVSLKLVALPKYMTSTETSFFMRDSIRANKIARGGRKQKKGKVLRRKWKENSSCECAVAFNDLICKQPRRCERIVMLTKEKIIERWALNTIRKLSMCTKFKSVNYANTRNNEDENFIWKLQMPSSKASHSQAPPRYLVQW